MSNGTMRDVTRR